MSDYAQAARTNYFHVTDEARFYELCSHLFSSSEDDEVKVFEQGNCAGETTYGFGCTGDFGYSSDGDSEEDGWCCSMEPFFQELQKILPDGEAVIYMEAGHRQLRSVYGAVWVVTNTQMKYIPMYQIALSAAQDLLGNSEFKTQLDY